MTQNLTLKRPNPPKIASTALWTHLSLLHWGPPRKPGGLLAALAYGPLVFSVGFGNIFILSMYRILWYRWNNITATCTRYSSVCTAICTINPRHSRLAVILILDTHSKPSILKINRVRLTVIQFTIVWWLAITPGPPARVCESKTATFCQF